MRFSSKAANGRRCMAGWSSPCGGLLRRYLEKMTGLSRAQVTRLIGLYLAGEPVQPKLYRRRRFPRRYTRADIECWPAWTRRTKP